MSARKEMPVWLGMKVATKRSSKKEENSPDQAEDDRAKKQGKEDEVKKDYEEEKEQSYDSDDDDKSDDYIERLSVMCEVCYLFYLHRLCEGCIKGWKDLWSHPCHDYGNSFCPDCNTDPVYLS